MSKLCPNCGKMMDDSLNKCSSCGTDLPTEVFNPIPVIQINETPKEEEESTSVVEIPSVNDVVEAVTVPIEEESPTPEVVEEVETKEVEPETVQEEVDQVVEELPKEETVVEEIPVVEEIEKVVEEGPLVEENPVVETVEEVVPEVVTETVNEVIESVNQPLPEETVEEVSSVPEIVEQTETESLEATETVVEELPNEEDVVEEPPTADTEVVETPVEEVVEVVETVPEVESLEDVPKVEDEVVNEDISVDAAPVDSLESAINDVPVITEGQGSEESTDEENVEEEKEETAEEKPKAVIDANTVIDVPEGIEEVSVDDLVNNDLESVSVQVEKEIEPTEEVIEKVELPDATVGEIDASLLTNMYEEEEKQNENNKKLLAKEEEEKRQREEAERLQKQKLEPKPDLMARVDYVVSNESPQPTANRRRKKNSSFLPKFFIILMVMLAAAGAYWFFFVKDSTPKEETYETTLKYYFKYLEDKDQAGILSTYVPCTRKDENVVNEIEVALAAYKQLGAYKIEYVINSVEVVNEADRASIKTTAIGTYCGVENIPEITDYKHLFVSQTIVGDERTTNDIELWVVQIDKKWYIVPITENLRA